MHARKEKELGGPAAFADLLRPLPRFMTLADVLGLVGGFAGAGHVLRGSVLAAPQWNQLGRFCVASIALAWLGVVMAGPLVMLIRRIQHGSRGRLTGGEVAWAVMGSTWLIVALLRAIESIEASFIPQLVATVSGIAAALGPVLFIGLWHAARLRPSTGHSAMYSWCHYSGIICSATWPVGWTLAALLLGA